MYKRLKMSYRGAVVFVFGALAVALAARPAPAVEPAAPALAVLVTRGLAPESTLHLLRAGDAELGPPLARIGHLPDGAVRGRRLPDGRVLVAAERRPVRDRSWSGALLLVEPGGAVRELCDRVDHASRPFVTRSGRVFVQRGRPGPAREGELRSDELSLDEVDLATGRTRQVFAAAGFVALLAGETPAGELVVYLVDGRAGGGAALLAVSPESGAARPLLAALPAFARDFSQAGARLVYGNRDAALRGRWVVEELDLATGAQRRLHAAAEQRLAPHLLPDGDVALASGGGEAGGLFTVGGRLRAPLGPGLDVVRMAAATGHLALWHYPPGGGGPDLVLTDAEARPLARIAGRDGVRLEPVGFVEGAR
jgi:hypothetical protein